MELFSPKFATGKRKVVQSLDTRSGYPGEDGFGRDRLKIGFRNG